MVTSSPFPTCSSPSQLVSMDAGLKSSSVTTQDVEAVQVNLWRDHPRSLTADCEDVHTRKM